MLFTANTAGEPGATMVIGIAALCLSILNTALLVTRGMKERKRSVEDIFWLRDVISPQCVIPLIQFILSTTKEIGQIGKNDGEKGATNSDKVRQYLEDFKKRKTDIVGRLQLLSILGDGSLFNLVSEDVDKIQDVIEEHCCRLIAEIDNDEEKGKRREPTESRVRKVMLNMLKRIKAVQNKM